MEARNWKLALRESGNSSAKIGDYITRVFVLCYFCGDISSAAATLWIHARCDVTIYSIMHFAASAEVQYLFRVFIAPQNYGNKLNNVCALFLIYLKEKQVTFWRFATKKLTNFAMMIVMILSPTGENLVSVNNKQKKSKIQCIRVYINYTYVPLQYLN